MREPRVEAVADRTDPTGEQKGELKTLAHTLALFELLREHPDGLGITRMAELLGLSKSAVFRIASTLRRHGYLDQASGRSVYRLGLRLWELGCAAANRIDLRRVARPALEALAAGAGEAAFLSVLDGRDIVTLDIVDGPLAPANMEMGDRAPAYCTASGRALLAFLPSDRQLTATLGPLRALTSRTVTDPVALRRTLAAARTTGVAVCGEEFREGTMAIASPVLDHAGRALAAVAVAGPTSRFTPARVARCTELVKDAAARISRHFGGRLAFATGHADASGSRSAADAPRR